MSVGVNVRRLRKERSIRQDELAAAINVHQTHISRIENGEKSPSLEVTRQLAAYFGVTLDELVGTPEEISEPA